MFTEAFTKRFAPLDTAEAAQEVLKALKQGKSSVAEYISKFDQYMGQTGWSATDHCTRFYDGLNNQLKDNLSISNRAIDSYDKLQMAAHVLDRRMRQCQAEKLHKHMAMIMPAPSKDPNAMEVDAS